MPSRKAGEEKGSCRVISVFNAGVKKGLTMEVTLEARKPESCWGHHFRQQGQ